MLDELGRVLSYPRLLRRSRLTPSGISEYLRFLPASAWLVEIDESVSAPIRDADDMHVILTAIVGSVEFLCTLDAHFYEPPVVTFCERLRIRVVDDVDLLHIIRTL